MPVRQKAHFKGQPAWVEMQIVRRVSSGMKTLSIVAPPSRPKRYFRVPSEESRLSTTSGQRSAKASSSLARSPLPRFVMSANDRARLA